MTTLTKSQLDAYGLSRIKYSGPGFYIIYTHELDGVMKLQVVHEMPKDITFFKSAPPVDKNFETRLFAEYEAHAKGWGGHCVQVVEKELLGGLESTRYFMSWYYRLSRTGVIDHYIAKHPLGSLS